MVKDNDNGLVVIWVIGAVALVLAMFNLFAIIVGFALLAVLGSAVWWHRTRQRR